MTCPQYRYPTLEDAMDRAELNGGVVIDAGRMCVRCSGWHLRAATDEQEAEQAGVTYRAHLTKKFPLLAERRGWTNA